MSEHIIKRASWCEHEYRRCPEGCPIEAAENRLREAHRRWHECAESYHNPDDFRDGLNSAIQALRNVTFALQSAKSQIKGFEEWYLKEQEQMRADPVLRWSLNARNTIVKQGDLKTLSRFKVTLIPSYEAEAAAVAGEQIAWEKLLESSPSSDAQTPVDVPVELTIQKVLEELHELDLPMSVRQNASVLFEHRWVDEKMPEYELLSLLAHSYGRLNTVLSRCHALMEMRTVRLSRATGGEGSEWKREELDVLPLDGRLPCMASTRDHRITRVRLSDGSEVKEYRNWKTEYDPEIAEMVQETGVYGALPDAPQAMEELQSSEQLNKLVAYYAELARAILQSGQDHGWFSFYFRKGFRVDAQTHVALDSQGKHAISAAISRTALELDADAVVIVGEAWMAPFQQTPDGAHVPPALSPARNEGVMIDAVAKSGSCAGGYLPFRVLQGEPPHREVEIDEFVPLSASSGLLLPTRLAWGLGGSALTGESFWRAQSPRRS